VKQQLLNVEGQCRATGAVELTLITNLCPSLLVEKPPVLQFLQSPEDFLLQLPQAWARCRCSNIAKAPSLSCKAFTTSRLKGDSIFILLQSLQDR
jgi:hypothetical protein